MRLGSAVTVLSSDDPVRLYQRFSTLNAASAGRAEVILGRGSFTESFPLFGYDLGDYETLFEEKLALFAALRQGGPVTWQGTVRAPLQDQSVYPAIEGAPLRTWVGVGGSPQSVVRAASHGLPLMLAIIGGDPGAVPPVCRPAPSGLCAAGQRRSPSGVHSPGHVADTDEQAREELWPHHQRQNAKIGAERGWPPHAPRGFRARGRPRIAVCRRAGNGGPAHRRDRRTLGLSRFDLKYSVNQLPHEALMHGIELYGTPGRATGARHARDPAGVSRRVTVGSERLGWSAVPLKPIRHRLPALAAHASRRSPRCPARQGSAAARPGHGRG